MVPAPGEPGSETWPRSDSGCLEDRRRLDLDHRSVRSRGEARLLGHRQRRPVDGRPAARRQPLRRLGRGARSRDRRDQGPLPVPPRTSSWDWDEVAAPILVDIPNGRRQTVPGLVHAARSGVLWELERTPEGPINFIKGDALREGELDREHGSGDRPHRRSPRARSRAPACSATSARRSGAARTGLRSPTDPDTELRLHPRQREPLLAGCRAARWSSIIPGASFTRGTQGRSLGDLHGRGRRSYRRGAGLGSRRPARRSGPIRSRTRRTGGR